MHTQYFCGFWRPQLQSSHFPLTFPFHTSPLHYLLTLPLHTSPYNFPLNTSSSHLHSQHFTDWAAFLTPIVPLTSLNRCFHFYLKQAHLGELDGDGSWFGLSPVSTQMASSRQQVPQNARGSATLCLEAILILSHRETEMEAYHHPKGKKTLAAPFRG